MNDDKDIISTISNDEKNIINSVYKYQIEEVESIRAEEIACTLSGPVDDIEDYNWNQFEKLTSSLIEKGLLVKNGDRYSIKEDMVYPLIDAKVINIADIINLFSIDVFYTKSNLKSVENNINELKKEKEKLEDDIERMKSQAEEYEQIYNNSLKNLENNRIKLVEFMGIFISIFTLISVNVNILKVFETVGSLWNMVLLLISINAVTVISLLAMLFYIKKSISNK